MSAIGKDFRHPRVTEDAVPGGWHRLKGSSSLITHGVEVILKYINNRHEIGDEINITVDEVATQVVSGLNLYLEITLKEPSMKIYAIVYNPGSTYTEHADTKVSQIYALYM